MKTINKLFFMLFFLTTISVNAFAQNRYQLNPGSQFNPQLQAPQIQQQRTQITQVTCRDRMQRVQSLYQAQYNISNYEKSQYCECASQAQYRVDNQVYNRLCGYRNLRRNDQRDYRRYDHREYPQYEYQEQHNGISKDAVIGGVIGGIIGGVIGGVLADQ